MKKILIILILALTLPIFAEEDVKNDVIVQKYKKKSAQKAMMLSVLFPGAGQFYVEKSSFRKYIFPIIELACIGGAVYFDSKGDDKTDEYKDFANERYNRTYQHDFEEILIDEGVCDPIKFALDDDNTQHFYEDIAKYDQYIFGWEDWHEDHSDDVIENYALNDMGEIEFFNIVSTKRSAYREEYKKIRGDAESHYDKKRIFINAILLNHAISSVDAFMMTKKYNKNYLKTNKVGFKLRPVMTDDNIGIFAMLEKRF